MLKKIVGLILMCTLLFTVAVSFASCDMFKKPDDDVIDETPDDGGTTPENPDDGGNTPENPDDGGNTPENPDDGGNTPEPPVEVVHTVTVVDAAGNAVAGAVVKLIPAEGDAVEKTTDAEGKITASLAGEWKAQLVSVPAGYCATAAQLGELSFTDAALTIEVSTATYMFTVKDLDDVVYAGATVTVLNMGEVIATATTDANGVCYVSIADGKANYTVNCELADADGYYVDDSYTDMETFAYDLIVMPPEGSEGNPIYPAYRDDAEDDNCELTLPVGTTYFMYFLAETTRLYIYGDVSLVIGEETINAVDGEIEYLMVYDAADADPEDYFARVPFSFAIVNNGTEDADVVIAWEGLPGSMGNPIEVEEGEGTVEVLAGEFESMFFAFTADKHYILTVTYSANATFGAMMDDWDTDTENVATVNVYKGKTVNFSFGLVDTSAAGTVNYTVALEEFVPVPDGSEDIPFIIEGTGSYTANVPAWGLYYIYTAPYKCTFKISTANSNAKIMKTDYTSLLVGAGDTTLDLNLGEEIVILIADLDWQEANIAFAIEVTKYVCTGVHAWDEGVITTPTSCAAPGVKTYTCTACAEIMTESIDALEHTMKFMPPRNADCENVGYTQHYACTGCSYTEDKVEFPALGHVCSEWTPVTAATCTDNGVKKGFCSRCETEIEGVLYADGHKFTSSTTSAADERYENAVCGVCGHIQYREKVGTITFDAGYLKASSALSYIVGALKQTGVGDASVEVGADSTAAGNAWIKYSIAGDTSDKVLDMVCDISESINYAESKLRIAFTDTVRDTKTDKYLVFDTDIKIDYDPTNLAMDDPDMWYGMLRFRFTDDGNNGLDASDLHLRTNELHVAYGSTGLALDPDDPKWLSFRIVYTLAEAKGLDGKYKGYIHIFAKNRDANEPWTLMTSKNISRDYSFTVDRPNYFVEIYHEARPDYFVDTDIQLDNISFIATSDPSYRYSDCNHVMGEWTVVSEPVDCATPGESTRTCINGCGLTETKLATIDHTLSDVEAKDATCGSAGYTAHQVCSECHAKIGYVEIPALGHILTDWVVEGEDQKRTCTNGCGYYELRDNVESAPITFDDGTITGGDKLVYPELIEVSEDKTTGAHTSGYVNYVVADGPNKESDKALHVTHDVSKFQSGQAPKITLAPAGTLNTGDTHIYTLEFDAYIASDTTNSTRSVFEFYFGGAQDYITTYGSNIRSGKGGSTNLGKGDTWMNFKAVYVVTEDGKAAYTLYYKNAADAEYKALSTKTLENAGIKVAELQSMTIVSYSGNTSSRNADYYLDNISFSVYTTGYAVAE